MNETFALLTVVSDMLWPLATVACFALGCYAFCKWLQRDHETVRSLQCELKVTQKEWSQRFETIEGQHDQRLATIEKRLSALTPAMNPLGSHYTTRSAG